MRPHRYYHRVLVSGSFEGAIPMSGCEIVSLLTARCAGTTTHCQTETLAIANALA